MSVASPAASRFRVESSIHPLLDSSQFSISRNLAMAQLAASVLWLEARLRISDTISSDTWWLNARMSQNFSFMSHVGLLPNTYKQFCNHLGTASTQSQLIYVIFNICGSTQTCNNSLIPISTQAQIFLNNPRIYHCNQVPTLFSNTDKFIAIISAHVICKQNESCNCFVVYTPTCSCLDTNTSMVKWMELHLYTFSGSQGCGKFDIPGFKKLRRFDREMSTYII